MSYPQGEEEPRGPGQGGLVAGSSAALGFPYTLSCHWTCFLSLRGPPLATPGPALQSAPMTVLGSCTHSCAPGQVQQDAAEHRPLSWPQACTSVCFWGGSVGLVSSAGT